MTRLPSGLLLAFYGDDFTGSTAVMEVLSLAGISTVLFPDLPTPGQLASFEGCQAIGIAGTARARSPAWMTQNLPAFFDFIARLKAPIAHYKVCSTLDSAPHVGSIGAAADLAIPRLGGRWHPIVIAAPAIARYQAFGNLFAMAGGEGFRLDRHPTMARHPVTPMDEADVRLHLGRQTERPIALIDLTVLKGKAAEARLATLTDQLVAIDVIDAETLAEAGRLIWQNRGERLFAIGSQGLEYALVAHWRDQRLLPVEVKMPKAGCAERIAVVSGSCSPVTSAQIGHALAHGFAGIALDVTRAVDEQRWQDELQRAEGRAIEMVKAGQDPLIFTARGPNDPSIQALNDALRRTELDPAAVHERIGAGLGRLLATIIERTGIRRAVIAGGDSSGHATTALELDALTALAPIAPGSMLCRAHRKNGELELALKGGQMGKQDYFCAVRYGHAIS